jgi:hypothetical protein
VSEETEDHVQRSTTETINDDALPPEQEERIVEKVVNRVKDVLTDIVGKPKEIADDDGTEDEPEAVTKEPTTVKEIETDFEAQVRKELAKIKAEDDHAAEHEKLKQEPERAPVQVGKVTRALWGGGE